MEEEDRAWIRKVAALSNRYGVEWDSLVVALLALVKLATWPARYAFRIAFRVWTFASLAMQAVGIPPSLVLSVMTMVFFIYTFQTTSVPQGRWSEGIGRRL